MTDYTRKQLDDWKAGKYILPAKPPEPPVRRTFERVYRPCTVKTLSGRWASVYIKAQYDGMRLSISGVIGPLNNGEAGELVRVSHWASMLELPK